MVAVGRVLLALMFGLASLGEIADIGGRTTSYSARDGLPMVSKRAALAVPVELRELVGGIAVAIGAQARH